MASDGPIRFEGWELRRQERQLLVAGQPVQVGGRAFDLLLVLVERRGRMVAKAELLEAAWPGLVVEENNVSVQIASLRKLLGQKAITTIAGQGYQLSAVPIGAAAVDGSANALGPDGDASVELLGRQTDLQEVSERMAESALVTIVGSGGVGKTSLAREVFARRCALVQQPGAWVDLAPVSEPRQVVGLIAKALGVEATEDFPAFIAAIGQLAAIVVLDNCEHLRGEAARVVGLALEGAPRLRWLATSQVPLHVVGEAVHRLAPLAVPSERGLPPSQAIEYGAIAMLCKRAAEANRRFRLDESNVDAAIELCDQLDGLPLAIEMAAARVATFGLDEVCQRLDQRMKLLTGGRRQGDYRHAALQDMYDWSYGLLSATEQAVFRRLEPFRDGFRSDMAQQVASDIGDGGQIDAWQALDALGGLIDKSLVQRAPDEQGRFHLLESARDYARARLVEAGEVAAVGRRHARAVASWFAEAHADADRMTDAQWIRHYVNERHNARAALAWAAENRAPEELAQLVAALAMMDWLLCRQAEILQCEVPLDVLAQASPKRKARAYLELSWAHAADGDHSLGLRLAQEAFEVFTQIGETTYAYRALAQITRLHETLPSMADQAHAAWARLRQFDDHQLPLRTRLFCAISAGLVYRADFTIERAQELGRMAEGAGFDSIAAICGCNLTDKLLVAGRHAEVVTTTDRLLRSVGHLPRASAFMLHNKAAALIREGRFDDAHLAGHQAFQAMPAIARFLVATFAFGAVREGRLADAAVLHGCGARYLRELHEQLDVSEAAALAETEARLKADMSASQLDELMSLGAAMAAHEALEIKVLARARTVQARGGRAEVSQGRVTSVGFAGANP